jgi:DNA-binding transcriptional ArsR family regulator
MTARVKLLPDDALREAAECLKAMAHPVRLKIVSILIQGEFAVHEISALAGISANQTCGHLRLLQARNLLASERRGRTVYYRIASARLPGLIQCIGSNYRRR